VTSRCRARRSRRTAQRCSRGRRKLLRPAHRPSGGSWTFLVLPRDASARLPTREDARSCGRRDRRHRSATDPSNEKQPERRVPVDLRKALAATPEARAVWSDITPIARRDWIHWITSAKRSETRTRRIRNACEMLAAGKRRVCCFDRSGFYSKSFGAPKAAD
jgi:hypothetical protein